MWMELHSPPNGIYLIDQRIAFYKPPHDLIPLVIEADPAFNWENNLVHVDQSNVYWTDRLRLVSFSSIVEIELAIQFGIDLKQKDAYYYVTTLMDDIDREQRSVQFKVPGDPVEYSWLPKRGIRVWLVRDGILEQNDYKPIYVLDDGDKVKIFEKEGVLECIISTAGLDQDLQHNGILAKILGPMFEVLLSEKGQLPSTISDFYDPNHRGDSPGDLSDLAGPAIVDGTTVPGFILLVGR